MSNRHIIDRKLPQKTFLKFYFPPEAEGISTVVTMPFFENPQIKERKKARYKKYNLMSRSSDLYSYLGAESRKISLNFNITLPHLIEEHRDAVLSGGYINAIAGDRTIAQIKEEFKSPTAQGGLASIGTNRIADIFHKFLSFEGLTGSAKDALLTVWGQSPKGIKPQERDYIEELYSIPQSFWHQLGENISLFTVNAIKEYASSQDVELSPDQSSKLQQMQDAIQLSAKDAVYQEKVRAIEVILYWVNIIRATVVNNASNPLKGPPIVRLNHGTLYQNIPCICTDYDIEFKEDWGYDINTLTPRRVAVKMNLEELRAGDFGKFNAVATTQSGRDNLAGWEAAINPPYTMDPGGY